MHTPKPIGVVALILTLAAISVGTASANVLPGNKGTKITGATGKTTLQVKGGISFTCEKSTMTGEVENTELSLVLINFEKCNSGGLPANSIGDAAKTILVHTEVDECFNAAHTEHYVSFVFLPVNIEIPSTKLTAEVTGNVLADVTPINKKAKKFTIELQQKEGLQEIGPTKCENSKKEKFEEVFLQTKVDNAVKAESGLSAEKGEMEFSAEEEFMV